MDLDIRLFDDHAVVGAKLKMTRAHAGELRLLGRDLKLKSIHLNGQELESQAYHLDKEGLTILDAPDVAVIETLVEISPQTNTTLEGLYQAGTGDDKMFVTQCEPEGFRKITFFPDRPDVLTEYTTRLEAPKAF